MNVQLYCCQMKRGVRLWTFHPVLLAEQRTQRSRNKRADKRRVRWLRPGEMKPIQRDITGLVAKYTVLEQLKQIWIVTP